MKNLEKKAEDKYATYVEKRGGLAIKFKALGRRGWPDRLTLLNNGKFFWMEFKAEGEEPRPLQSYIHKKLKKLKHKIYTCDNYEKAIKIFEREVRT